MMFLSGQKIRDTEGRRFSTFALVALFVVIFDIFTLLWMRKCPCLNKTQHEIRVAGEGELI